MAAHGGLSHSKNATNTPRSASSGALLVFILNESLLRFVVRLGAPPEGPMFYRWIEASIRDGMKT
jgi:hypothetical protein